jgi:predicted enzyme related to lactoylglutathione lyase
MVVVLPSQIFRAYKRAINNCTGSNLRAIALGLKNYEVVKRELQLKPENPLTYFEIPVTDLERAIRFYEIVFDCKLDQSTIDGNEMAIFPGTPRAPGCIGALAKGPTYKPYMDGARIYFHTDDIEGILEIVVSSGGKIEYPKTSIGELGSVAEFFDTEGNRIALHSPKKE